MAVLDAVEREALTALQAKRVQVEGRIEATIRAIAERHGLKREQIANIDLVTGDIIETPPKQPVEKTARKKKG